MLNVGVAESNWIPRRLPIDNAVLENRRRGSVLALDIGRFATEEHQKKRGLSSRNPVGFRDETR
jgi:hypothetical protein